MGSMTYQSLIDYLTVCHTWDDPALLVVGHAAPDGDAALSALFEAWRRHLVDGVRAMPVVQGAVLPREVAYLLGGAAPLVPMGETLSRFPHTPLVLTDCHMPPAGRTVAAVVDHHLLATGERLEGVPALIEKVGATTTLVTGLCRKEGLVPDESVARILLGAILLDTDGLSPQKAKPKDLETVGWLVALCGEETAVLYKTLQAHLLAETDVTVLYERDYRLYGGTQACPFMGFAILKAWEAAPPDSEAVRQLVATDIAAGRCRLAVAKVSLYDETGLRSERYIAAGEGAEAMLTLVAGIAGEAAVRVAPDELLLPPSAYHKGRKSLAALLLETFDG